METRKVLSVPPVREGRNPLPRLGARKSPIRKTLTGK